MSSFLCKSETLSLIAEYLADYAEKTSQPCAGNNFIQHWFDKILKMNQIASGDNDSREYIQRKGKIQIRPADIVSACSCYEYQTAGKFTTENGHRLDFDNNKTMHAIRAIGYEYAKKALQSAAAQEMMRAGKEYWG